MKQRTKEIIITSVIIIIILIFILVVFIGPNIVEIDNSKQVCYNNNHKELTDSDFIVFSSISCVECDYDFMYCKDYENKICDDKNKWGECISWHYPWKLREDTKK